MRVNKLRILNSSFPSKSVWVWTDAVAGAGAGTGTGASWVN